ncbi:receptor-like protein kinase [Dorcoceras hygrometricum]|uniref:non-specific serine/threonine protein kinase n=1 Tax=Dorcoceras hygrometricum TaxID=472368 RepID=A0A2Z7A4F6_9LAMI|nr:receptor-like protein kinase [Dorcoceras hygrometricum]
MKKSKGIFQQLVKPWLPNASRDQNEDDLERIAAQEQKLLSFGTLVASTKNFHHSRKLGEGAFGPVFKGKLPDGKVVAVKKLSHSSTQGKEFKTEAKKLARVQHRNVVNLLGYCAHGEENFLVYEYVANESLDKHLFRSDGREAFNWERRLDTITGIAKGLLYLHEKAHIRIIHRDIKAGNILLDDKWVPKIADFGMARLFPDDQTRINTRVAGANGYMSPEYLMHGSLSIKADVFSFGVVVLELISGEKNFPFTRDSDSKNLLEWAFKLFKKQRALEIMDPALASSADPQHIAMCIHMGLLCVQSDPDLRPDMGRVVMILSKKLTALEEPSRPGYPGSRYRRSRTPGASSSGTGYSGPSNSLSFGSTSSSKSATSSSSSEHTSIRSDPHGKRPM